METRPFQVYLICSFCSSDRGFASDFFQTPPHDGRPCLRLTVPTAKSVVDFHHQVIMRAEHTKRADRLNVNYSLSALRVYKSDTHLTVMLFSRLQSAKQMRCVTSTRSIKYILLDRIA